MVFLLVRGRLVYTEDAKIKVHLFDDQSQSCAHVFFLQRKKKRGAIGFKQGLFLRPVTPRSAAKPETIASRAAGFVLWVTVS